MISPEIVSAFATATIVSLVGVIGFVGLMVPHIARAVTGVTHGALSVFSLVFGAGLLADERITGNYQGNNRWIREFSRKRTDLRKIKGLALFNRSAEQVFAGKDHSRLHTSDLGNFQLRHFGPQSQDSRLCPDNDWDGAGPST